MANNTNTSFKNKVRVATALTVAGVAGLTAHNSQPMEECDVPVKGTIAETVQEVESVGADASSAELLDVNHQPVDPLSRPVNVDGSPVVYDETSNPGRGDVLRVTADPKICHDVGEIVINATTSR